jgi:hypothetical protein
MTADEQISRSLFLLLSYMEEQQFKGFDPYDGLTSPVFQLPILKSQHKLRFLAQQSVKRSPVNLRPLLGIKKRLNPVTIGLALQSYAQLYSADPKPAYKEKALHCIQQLKTLKAKNYSGACWGYDFPWEARYASIPAYEPTVVATGIITHGLFHAYKTWDIKEAGDLVVSAAEFVLHDLYRSIDPDQSICFSYSPFDKEKVFNASMKGVRLLAQAYSITSNEELKSTATAAVNWVMKYQNSEGAWIYSQRETGKWIDNYHTGYILDCLSEFIRHTNDSTHQQGMDKGISFYLRHFLEADGQPRFYDKQAWPVDCTAAGQTLLTLQRFGQMELAKKTACWMIREMQDPKGYFYFRKFERHTEKTSFMRWSNAWMLAGLSALQQPTNKN